MATRDSSWEEPAVRSEAHEPCFAGQSTQPWTTQAGKSRSLSSGLLLQRNELVRYLLAHGRQPPGRGHCLPGIEAATAGDATPVCSRDHALARGLELHAPQPPAEADGRGPAEEGLELRWLPDRRRCRAPRRGQLLPALHGPAPGHDYEVQQRRLALPRDAELGVVASQSCGRAGAQQVPVLPPLPLKEPQLGLEDRLSALPQRRHPGPLRAAHRERVQGPAGEREQVASAFGPQRRVILPVQAQHLRGAEGLSSPEHAHGDALVRDLHLAAVHDEHCLPRLALTCDLGVLEAQSPVQVATDVGEEVARHALKAMLA
mmetsp:Transcript_6803/g.21213  ORF Transcript_6803/g.21213 Transcript_6803/m.21213 type:complete len:317 (+) Transcript_6803:218-1168(+)